MRMAQIKSLLTKSMMVLWVLLNISVFIYYPGKANILYGATLGAGSSLLPNILRIDFIGYLINLLWALFGAMVFSAICISAGSFLFPIFRPKSFETNLSIPSAPALVATAFAIGQGLISIVLLILAKFNQLTALHVILVSMVCICAGIPTLSKFVTASQIKKIHFSNKPNNLDKALIGLVISVLVLSLMYSTARLSYDSVALYFSAAKITALTHRIQFFSNDSFIVSFFQTGIQYSALIQVFGDQAARVYSWINGIFILIFVVALSEKAGLSRRANLILLTLILTSTAFLDLMGDGKIELASTVPAIGAIYWLVLSKSNANKNILLVAGFLAGLAMIDRPYNIFLLTVSIGLFHLLYSVYQRKANLESNFSFFVKPLLWISVGVICLMAYHLIENWFILGNPLAFLINYQKVNSSDWQWALDPKQIWIFRLLYPLVVTYLNTPQSLGNITPLFLSFLIFLFIKELREKVVLSKILLIIIFAISITLTLWITLLFTVFEIRYVLFLWLILYMPLALIIEKILENKVALYRLITNLTLIILMLFILVRIINVSLQTYSPIDQNGNPHCFDFAFCNFLNPVNNLATPGNRVLTLNAYRYYLRTDLFACSTTSEEYSKLNNLSKEGNTAFWTEVYREGYKFITYESNYSVRHLYMDFIPNPNNTPSWLTLKPIYGQPGDPEVAYQIEVENAPINIEWQCQKSLNGDWELHQVQ